MRCRLLAPSSVPKCSSTEHFLSVASVSNEDEDAQRPARWLKENYIDKGKLGLATGENFYKY